MTDFDYDVMQRKRIASQSKYRKCGSKSKRCSLTTDNMTNKQWKERCGAIITYDIGNPMKWKEFKKLPEDIQKEYITTLHDKYCVGVRKLSEMFGCSPTTVYSYISNKLTPSQFDRSVVATEEQLNAWAKFIGEKPELETDIEKCSIATVEPTAVENRISPQSFQVVFSGVVDLNNVFNSIRYMVGGSNAINGRLEVNFSV